MPPIKPFVSSVSTALKPIRDQIIADLNTAGFDVAAMERFGAQPNPPIEVCLREVRKSDVVLLIVGPRYGSLLPQGISYTHAEYREARAASIPVLAFVVPDEAGIDGDETTRLANFRAEVGSTGVYVALVPNEPLSTLSGKVLASLTAAQRRGDLAGRFALFRPFDQFFAPQLSASCALFNHTSGFVGRKEQLQQITDFIGGDESLLILSAPSGSGKSRLLLEAAKRATEVANSPRVLFADSGAQWTAEDISRLPTGPTVIVFDDAHRRPDLDRLIAACRQQNEDTRCIVSCRPSAVGIVRPLIAQLLSSTDVQQVTLPLLSKQDAERLAADLLGKDLRHLAPQLVNLADQNPLVICVGARCIAEKRVLPEVLERTPEAFRAAVLDRLLDDPALQGDQAMTRRRLLEVLSAIAPVNPENEELIGVLAQQTKAEPYEVRRELATLESHGFLIRRGRSVRISPDVLSDHLLYRAAVSASNTPTGFVDAMVSAFAPGLLENILANAAELDWRAAATAKHEAVLATTWQRLQDQLPVLTNPQRQEFVKQLNRAAVFAPEPVLRLAEWLTDHPTAPPDEHFARWGIEDTPDRVTEALVDLFAFIATHPDFTERCLNRLWTFAERDERPTNPNPGHPRRRIKDLLKYDRRSDWYSHDGVHSKATAFLIRRLSDSTRAAPAVWAIPVLGQALARVGEANSATRRQFTLGEFALSPHYAVIEGRRQQVVDCLRTLTLGTRPIEAVAALGELSELTRAHHGAFGRAVTDEELATWVPEVRRAIDVLREAALSARSDVVRFLARRELRQFRKGQWPALEADVEKALVDCTPIANEKLYDLLIGLPWEEELESYEDEEKRVDDLCKAAAVALWERSENAQQAIETLVEGRRTIATVTTSHQDRSPQITRHLLEQKPDQAESAFTAIVELGEDAWSLLQPTIISVFRRAPADALSLVRRLLESETEKVRAYGVNVLQFMADGGIPAEDIIEIARQAAHDSSVMVRRQTTHVFRALRKAAPKEAIAGLVGVAWDDDLELATSVLDVLDERYGLDPALLTDSEIDALLARIGTLQSLEQRSHDILQFLAYASTRRPIPTVEMLLRRIMAVDEHSGSRGADRWTPIPYNGSGLTLPGLSASGESGAAIRLVRDATLNASMMVEFWLPHLFEAVSGTFDNARPALLEWVRSGDELKIVAAAHLLQAFDREVVFTFTDFIAELLTAAEVLGDECLQDTRGKLFGAIISGVQTGAPGQPMPRDLSDKAKGNALAQQYASVPVVKKFFEDVIRGAEANIERSRLDWDDEGDDE